MNQVSRKHKHEKPPHLAGVANTKRNISGAATRRMAAGANPTTRCQIGRARPPHDSDAGGEQRQFLRQSALASPPLAARRLLPRLHRVRPSSAAQALQHLLALSWAVSRVERSKDRSRAVHHSCSSTWRIGADAGVEAGRLAAAFWTGGLRMVVAVVALVPPAWRAGPPQLEECVALGRRESSQQGSWASVSRQTKTWLRQPTYQKERRGRSQSPHQQLAIGRTLGMVLRPAMRRGGHVYFAQLWREGLLLLLRGLVKRVVRGNGVQEPDVFLWPHVDPLYFRVQTARATVCDELPVRLMPVALCRLWHVA